MKRLLTMMICALFAFSMASAQETKKKSNVVKTTFLVESMECENCVKKIEKNIAFEKGVTDLKCELTTKTVEVTYRSDKTTEDKLIAAFKKIDKPAKVLKEDTKP
jgi:Cu2+-exporting ATPase